MQSSWWPLRRAHHRDVRGRGHISSTASCPTSSRASTRWSIRRVVLEEDDFATLSRYASNGTMIIVFDGAGNKLYSSGGTLASEITSSELSVINDYVDNTTARIPS